MKLSEFRLCLLHLYLGMCEFGDGLYANHTADGLDDDLRDDSHQDEGHGVGGSVADHRGLGIRLAGDGAQGRGGGHAAADAAQAFQNVHLEDFHADKVAGEHARAGDDDAHHKRRPRRGWPPCPPGPRRP